MRRLCHVRLCTSCRLLVPRLGVGLARPALLVRPWPGSRFFAATVSCALSFMWNRTLLGCRHYFLLSTPFQWVTSSQWSLTCQWVATIFSASVDNVTGEECFFVLWRLGPTSLKVKDMKAHVGKEGFVPHRVVGTSTFFVCARHRRPNRHAGITHETNTNKTKPKRMNRTVPRTPITHHLQQAIDPAKFRRPERYRLIERNRNQTTRWVGRQRLRARAVFTAPLVAKEDEERAAWLESWKRKNRKRRKKKLTKPTGSGTARSEPGTITGHANRLASTWLSTWMMLLVLMQTGFQSASFPCLQETDADHQHQWPEVELKEELRFTVMENPEGWL